MNNRMFFASMMALSTAIAGSAAVAAPSTAPQALDVAAAEGADVVAGDIVVTARRREEKLQTVPISVSAFSQEDMKKANVKGVNELQFLVPALSAGGGYRENPNMTIRGQGTNGTGLPGVIEYFNEIPLPVDRFGAFGGALGPGLFYDLENVQVLKGPQGTLFGRNSTGGAILLQSRRPTNDFGGYAQVSVGNYSNREIDAAINIPIVADKVLMRLAVNGQDQKGFTRLLGDPASPNGKDIDNIHYLSWRGTLVIQPTDTLKSEFIYSGLRSKTHGTSGILSLVDPNGDAAQTYPEFLNLFAQQQQLGIRTQLPSNRILGNKRYYTFLSNTTTLSLSDTISLRNIAGYTRIDRGTALEYDGTALPVQDFSQYLRGRDSNRQWTEEFQIQGDRGTGNLTWVAGVFYLKAPIQPFASYEENYLGYQDVFGSREGERSIGLYAQATYDLSSWLSGLKFNLGGRYTWDKRAGEATILNPDGSCTVPPSGADANCVYSARSSQSAPTWTVGFDYQASPSTLVYVTSRRGYRTGGFNTYSLDTPFTNFKPEYVTDAELGLKTDYRLAGMRARTNAAIYYQKYTDIQVRQDIFYNGRFTRFIQNAAAARALGAEIEGSLQVTRELRLGGNFTWLERKYTSVEPGVNLANLKSVITRNAPKYKYGLSGNYALPVDESIGEMSLGAYWSWQSSNGDTLQPGGLNPSYGLLTLSANWDNVLEKPIDASFFMTNALNKKYRFNSTTQFNAYGYAFASYGAPRMYGARLRYRF